MSAEAGPQFAFQGRRVAVEVMTAPNGYRFEVVRHPSSVVVLPILRDGSIVLIRNERVAVGSDLWELPAGTLEAGEVPALAAERELAEETGYRAGRVEALIGFFASPGFLDEKLHAFVASDLTDGEMSLDPGESITVHPRSRDDVLAMIRKGEIEDGKTIATFLYWNTFCRGAEA